MKKGLTKGRKYIYLSFAILLALVMAIAGGCGGGSQDQGKEPIVIGLINSITGEAASTGIYVQHGVEMAVEEWNEKGGIDGRPIKLVTEDDTGQAAGAVNAFKKMTREQKPLAILLPNYSVMTMAVMPSLPEVGIPCLTGATNPKITQEGNEWIFRVRTNDAMMGKLVAEYAIKQSDKIAIIHDTNEFGRGGEEAVIKTLAERNLTPLANEGYNTGDKNFTAQLLKIQKSGAEVLIGWGHPLEDGLIMRQIKELGIDIQLIGAAPYGQPVALDLAKEAADGVIFAQEYSAYDTDPKVQAWAQKYNAKWKQVSEFNGSSYYDAMNLILDTIQKNNPQTPLEMKAALEKVTNYVGMSGTFGFDETHEGFRKAVMVKVNNGKPEVVDKIELPLQ